LSINTATPPSLLPAQHKLIKKKQRTRLASQKSKTGQTAIIFVASKSVELATLNESDWNDYVRALDLFNRKYFWECHEVLEDVWMMHQPPLKTFLQGIIQSAAAFYHVLGENPRGAIKLASDARSKLKNFAPHYLGLNLDLLIQELQFFEDESNEILTLKKTQFTLDRIPTLSIPQKAHEMS